MARGERPAPAAARRATPARASPRHLEWERTLFDARCAVVSWPRGVRRPRREPVGVAHLRGGVLPRPARRSGSRRTASSCSRRRSSSSAPPEQQDRILPKMACGEQTWCQGWSEPERGQRPRRHPEQGGARRRGRRLAARPVRRRGRRAARSARTSSGCSAPTPTPSATAASPTSSSTSRRPASRCAASSASTATRASPRCSSTTCSSPTTDVLGERRTRAGRVAMATTGSERGLTLRSPGPLPRDRAAADRALHRRAAATATRRCATASSRRTSTPRPTAGRRSGPSRGSSTASAPARSRAW